MPDSKPTPSRRGFFIGAAGAGAVAATVTALPHLGTPEPVAEAPKAMPEKGGGYSLSEHVQRYYKTTRI